jgi:phospholipase C
MPRPRVSAVVCCLSSTLLIILCGCGGGSSSSSPRGSVQLSVQAAGGGGGTVSSNPAGINCGQTCTASFSSGTQVTLTASPAANSYFAGWSGACSGAGACQVTLTQNTSVTANFSAWPMLTVTLGGSGKGSVSSSPSGINCGQTCRASFAPNTSVTLTATAVGNSSFVGWTGACTNTTSTCTLTLSTSQQVTANFAAASAPVLMVNLQGNGTVTSSPAGISCGSQCTASFNIGTQVTLTATAASNSTFAGWSGGGCSGTGSTCVVTMNASQQVTATFTSFPLSVTLAGTGTGTVSSTPTGINCPQTCQANFAPNSQVILTAAPVGNSAFAGWSGGGCSGTGFTCQVTMNASEQVTATFTTSPLLTVSIANNGTATGTVTSNPAGINCPQTCTANFPPNIQVTLTETPGQNSNFVGWSGGGCSGVNSTCVVTMNADQQVTAKFSPQDLTAINHIIFLAQENRSFDHYFGALREYWRQNGYLDQSFDGLPQFNPTTGKPPLYGPPPTNPGCNPNNPNHCVFDTNNPITSLHLITQCIETPAPFWNFSHVDWDYFDPVGKLPAALNGFVWSASGWARFEKFYDTNGIRAMSYYDGGDLNYYYFMASKFGTSDRWFSPLMTRTAPNREYLVAATSQGYAYPVGTNKQDSNLLTAPTIFQELEAKGISWKIYVNPIGSKCSGPPYDPACLLKLSYIQNFKWGQTIPTQYPQNLGTIGFDGSDFSNDLSNGTLPQVAQIEPATDAGFDEHPSDYDAVPNNSQDGANYVATRIINELMASSYWVDSAFVFTFDEFGGFFDHVPPYQTVSPDGIKPVDLNPGDVCTQTSGPLCDFVYTGYRLPLVVVSPFTKQNYVSHTPADTTAILKLIETRFGLPNLTKRDAAQMDMTEFFDFTNPAWLTPPSPPAQNTAGACYLDHLP